MRSYSKKAMNDHMAILAVEFFILAERAIR